MNKCGQQGCESVASYRYTWPNRDEMLICEEHVGKLRNVAATMGLHLQTIPLNLKAWPDDAIPGVAESTAEGIGEKCHWSIEIDVDGRHPMGHVSMAVPKRPKLDPVLLDALEQAGVYVRVDPVKGQR